MCVYACFPCKTYQENNYCGLMHKMHPLLISTHVISLGMPLFKLEFYDLARGSLAQWFPAEDTDCVLAFGSAVAILIVRGSWKKLRFCCYVVKADDERAAELLKAAVLGRVQKRRDHIRKKVRACVTNYTYTLFCNHVRHGHCDVCRARDQVTRASAEQDVNHTPRHSPLKPRLVLTAHRNHRQVQTQACVLTSLWLHVKASHRVCAWTE